MSEARAETPDEKARRARIEAGVLSVREGHGANCSSVGSVIDTIFATAVVGGAVFAAVVASLAREKPRAHGASAESVPVEPIPSEASETRDE